MVNGVYCAQCTHSIVKFTMLKCNSLKLFKSFRSSEVCCEHALIKSTLKKEAFEAQLMFLDQNVSQQELNCVF